MSKLLGVLALVGAVVGMTVAGGAGAAVTGNLIVNSQANEGLNGWAQCSPGLAGVRTYSQSNTPNIPAHPGTDEPWLFSGYRPGSAFNRQSNKCLVQRVSLASHQHMVGNPHAGWNYRFDAGNTAPGSGNLNRRDGAQVLMCDNYHGGYFACVGPVGRAPGTTSFNQMVSYSGNVPFFHTHTLCGGAPCGAAQSIDVYQLFTNYDPPGPATAGNNTGGIDHIEIAVEDNP